MTNRESRPLARSCPDASACLTSCAISVPVGLLRCPARLDIRCNGVDPCGRRRGLSRTVLSWLKDRKLLEQAGGPMAIGRIATDIPVLGHAVDHARKIAMKAKRRAFIPDAEAKAMECRGNIENEAEWLDEATRGLRKHADASDHRMQSRPQVDGCSPKAQSIGQRARRRGGYSTGSKNSIGSRPDGTEGHITLVSGETSAGKSAFTVSGQDRCKLASNRGGRTQRGQARRARANRRGDFTLEMEHDEVSQRLCCGIGSKQLALDRDWRDRTNGPTIPRSGGRRTLATPVLLTTITT